MDATYTWDNLHLRSGAASSRKTGEGDLCHNEYQVVRRCQRDHELQKRARLPWPLVDCQISLRLHHEHLGRFCIGQAGIPPATVPPYRGI